MAPPLQLSSTQVADTCLELRKNKDGTIPEHYSEDTAAQVRRQLPIPALPCRST